MKKQCVSLFGITNEGDSKQDTSIIPEYEAKHYGKGPMLPALIYIIS